MRMWAIWGSVCVLTVCAAACGGSPTGSAGAGSYESIYEAARAGDLAAVKARLASGDTAMDRDAEGNTPLHYAAVGGNRDVIEFLIEQGADINATNNQGMRPMGAALRAGNSIAEEALDRLGGIE